MSKDILGDALDCPFSKRLVRSLLAAGEHDPTAYGVAVVDLDTCCRAAIGFIQDFRTEYGKMPTEEQLLENHDLRFTKEPEDPRYVAGVLLRNRIGTRFEEDLKKAARLLREHDLQAAIDFIQAQQYGIRQETVYEFAAGWEDRYARYLAARDAPTRGIPFPWESLNFATELLPGELSVFIAQSGTGKSWASCAIAACCLKQNFRTLLITMEMSAEAFEARLDAIYYQLPFRDRKGELDVFTEQKWLERMKETKEGEIYILDDGSVASVQNIYEKVLRYEPDVVVVDGGYLLSSDVRGSNWEKTADVVKLIQHYCKKTKIPWVVTTQQNAPDKKMMTSQDRAGKVRYGKEWWLAANNMVEISQSDEQRDILRQITLRILKWREADKPLDKPEFTVWLDAELGRYHEVRDEEIKDGVVEVDY